MPRTSKLAMTLILVFLSSCSTFPTFHLTTNSNKELNNNYYRGVFHVHSQHSHDSSGSLTSLRQSAKRLNLDFVVITDHNTLSAKNEINSARKPDDPLLIVGNEISTTDGHLISLGTDFLVETPVEPQKAIDLIHQHHGYAVIAHPICDRTAWKAWSVTGYDGIEVYNYACDFYQSNKLSFFFKSLLLTPSSFVKHTVLEPREALQKWDSILMGQSIIPAFAAADAHERYGFGGFFLMRYDLSFRAATLYVKKDNLSEQAILENLFSGQSFIAFESLGRVDHFSFEAQTAGKTISMGESAQTENPVSFSVSLARKSEIRLMRNGQLVKIVRGKNLTFDTQNLGTYRVEIFINEKLWIISNPISIHE